MKKCVLIMVLMLGMALGVMAQTKFDPLLNHIVQGQKTEKFKPSISFPVKKEAVMEANPVKLVDTPKMVSVLAVMKIGSELPEARLAELGITVEFHEGKFATLNVPVGSLQELEKLEEFVSFEENRILKLDNDNSHKANHVIDLQNETKATAGGLPQTYTGKGVVVGVFDSGIDFNHNNFRNPVTHETRIKKAIVYYGSNTKDASIYTEHTDIDGLTTDCDEESHGTHTSSTAAGSYTGSYVNKSGSVTYTGVQGAAPEADLVLAGTSLLYNTCQQHALTEMDKTATELGEPLVVNLSIGSNGGFLDGKDAMCQFYDSFTDNGNKPGRIICISAGNEGDENFTIDGKLNSSNSYTISTFIPTTTYSSSEYFLPDIGIYGKNGTQFTVQLDFYDKDFKYKSSATSSVLVNGKYLSYGTYSDHDGKYAAILSIDKTAYKQSSDKYYCAVTIKSESDCDFFLFSNNGDLSDNNQEGFTAGTPDLSINYLVCTNSVLSVGAWNSHNGFNSYNGSSYSYSTSDVGDVGDIAAFSSYTTGDGNGVKRPDFASPGISIVSGYNSYDTSVWKSKGSSYSNNVCGKAKEVYLSGHTSIIGAMCGTSMACPNAVGLIALWLQKNPNLTVNQIREIIKATADNDSWTSAKPVRFGAGKINALNGVKNFDYAATKAILSEEEDYPVVGIWESPQTYNIKLARTMKTGRWNSLMLPFSMTASEVKANFGSNVKLMKMTGINKGVVSFANATTIEPAEAYIVQPTEEIDTISVVGKTGLKSLIDDTNHFLSLAYGNDYGQRKFGDWNVVSPFYYGTYSQEASTPSYVLSGNKFYKVTSDITIKGYRWMIKDQSGSGARELILDLGGETDDIDEVMDGSNGLNGLNVKSLENGRIVIIKGNQKYNLNGQEVK